MYTCYTQYYQKETERIDTLSKHNILYDDVAKEIKLFHFTKMFVLQKIHIQGESVKVLHILII